MSYSQRFGKTVLLAVYGSGSVSTSILESSTYPSKVPTPLFCLSFPEFPRETSLGPSYSYYSSMTFLSVFCTLCYYCSQMTPNFLCGSYSSMSPNAHCCPLVQTIFPYYINNCEITSRSHHEDLGITTPVCLSISPGLSILLKSLPNLTVCSTELSWLPTASQQERVYTFPWSTPNYSTVLRFGDWF